MINRNKTVVLITILLIVAFCVWSIAQSVNRAGKIGIEIVVMPEDASVFVDGKMLSPGRQYINPGSHKFKAHKVGFSDDEQTVDISSDFEKIILLPTPLSEDASDWASSVDVQAKREALGGEKANIAGKKVLHKNPLITKLPYYDIAGPFSIDYGPSVNKPGDVFIVIGNSNPTGRQSALNWIRDQGYELSDLDIRFSDFDNPLIGGSPNAHD